MDNYKSVIDYCLCLVPYSGFILRVEIFARNAPEQISVISIFARCGQQTWICGCIYCVMVETILCHG